MTSSSSEANNDVRARLGGLAPADIIDKQRLFFATGTTRRIDFRRTQLKRLYQAIKKFEPRISEALALDMNKPFFEGYSGEVGFILEEIRFLMKNIKKWSSPSRVPTPFLHWVGRSEIHFEPRGVVLVIGPWNYPFQLLIAPLIGAIAAGNTVVLKPSEIARHTERVLVELISETFDPKFVTCYCGGVTETTTLLAEPVDYIFFTGGNTVAKIVMAAAAKHLTPLTLELGGKSPAIIDRDADIEVTARRLVWGKFYNAGQTCVAPDYLLVHQSIKDQLLSRMVHYIEQFYGPEPMRSPHYASIIDGRHFDRLTSLLGAGKVVRGSQTDRERLRIAPTIIDGVTWSDPVMADEIFGPILPVMTFDSLENAVNLVKSRPHPLALYFFSKDKTRQDYVLREATFGGGCVNDTLVHLSNPNLPFGGVGASGMGAYHGRFSFETFSHRKGVFRRTFFPDPPVRYAPYDRWKARLIRFLMR